MIELDGEENLNQILKAQSQVYVLFYATWCPFSQRFLPVYTKCTAKNPATCVRIAVDNEPQLCDQYDIDVYPTVILFADGKVARRLDGVHGAGLSEGQLKGLLQTR